MTVQYTFLREIDVRSNIDLTKRRGLLVFECHKPSITGCVYSKEIKDESSGTELDSLSQGNKKNQECADLREAVREGEDPDCKMV